MRTDIDSKVKRQRMLVYIKLHNVRICIFVVSGAAEGESLSNLCRAARGAQTVGVRYHGVSHTP